MSSPNAAPTTSAREHPYGRSAVLITDVSLVLMAVIWGVNFSVVKYGTEQLSALAFNGARVMLAAVALAMLAFIPRPARISRRDIGALLLLGVLGNGVYQVLFIEGVAITRAGDAALVVAASPALIALAGRILGIERVTRRGGPRPTLIERDGNLPAFAALMTERERAAALMDRSIRPACGAGA